MTRTVVLAHLVMLASREKIARVCSRGATAVPPGSAVLAARRTVQWLHGRQGFSVSRRLRAAWC